MKALTTPRSPQMPIHILSSEKPFEDFKTLNDPELEKMARAGLKFCFDARNRGVNQGQWISFVGLSGNGKTFLAEMIYKRTRQLASFKQHESLLRPNERVFWPELVRELRRGEYHRIKDLGDCNLVLFDELVIEHDPSGFVRDNLCEVLKRRARKWTIITSNLTLDTIRAIDARIASMMVRDGSAVIGCNAMDYALRKQN